MLFCERVVVRVHRRRRHAPTRSCRAACRSRLICRWNSNAFARCGVAERVAAHDRERAVVAPAVRIADLVRDRVQLRRAPASSSRRSSTCSVVDVLLERRFELVRPSCSVSAFACGAERLLRRMPCRAPRRDRRRCTATQRFQRGRSSLAPVQRRAVEAEVLVHERPRTGSAAVACTSCQRRYVLTSSSGVDAMSWSNALKNSGSATLIASNGGAPARLEVARPVEGGVSACSSAGVIL